MYISNMCQYKLKCEESESKCNRIFRPWDSASASQDNSQDSTVSSTISNTTDADESIHSETKESLDCCEKIKQEEKPSFRPVSKPEIPPQLHYSPVPQMLPEYPVDFPIYPDMMQANIAQSLGLTPTDPLFLESMAHGYALEEYARVLSQEHQAKMLQAKKQRPKKYKCPHCNVGFSNNGQLKGHIRIHTGERPFKCDEKDCGKTFTRNEELTRHKRIHSGLRPFPCSHCGKRFGRKDHLKKHSRTHFQPRGVYAVPVMLPYETWASSSSGYPFVPMLY